MSTGLCQIYVGYTAKGGDLLHKDNADQTEASILYF